MCDPKVIYTMYNKNDPVTDTSQESRKRPATLICCYPALNYTYNNKSLISITFSGGRRK